MEDIKNNNINPNSKQETTQPSYEFKDDPIQLVFVSDGLLETTTEAINILTALKNQKLSILSINGPLNSGKTTLASNVINKQNNGFKIGQKTEGIWLWGNPITLKNGTKLLVLDCQGLNKADNYNISQKLFMLNVLLSTYIVYNTQGELTENIINDFIYYADLTKKINVDNIDKLNNINNLKSYFPELAFVNNNLSSEKIKDIIEKNPNCANICKLFEKRNYFNSTNLNELIESIKNNIKPKSIDNNIMDGDSLFGLLQNYLDFINNDEIPIINSALENVLLSKAKNESEFVFEDFKNIFTKKIKYPMSITDIYKLYLDLQQKSISTFSKKVEKILTPSQTGEYIQKLLINMEKELESTLDTNKEYYDEWFGMEYKELEEELNKINLHSIEQIKIFILSYTSTFQTCLNKFLNIPNNNFCQNLVSVLSKIFQEFVVNKLNKIGEQINSMYENVSKEYNTNIEELNNNIKKLNDQIDNNKKLLDDKNEEKSETNRSFLELETKLDKLNRENKLKEKEYENNLNIEIQKFQKMEAYYSEQIKEKEQSITTLENKIEKLNQDILGSNKESTLKANELARENLKLQSEIERMKKTGGGGANVLNEQNSNLQTLFKNIQSTFMEFKESVDQLDKENENVFKTKYLESSTKEVEGKLKNCVNDVRNFCESQVKTMNENYEKEIKKAKDECEELNFELSKKNFDVNEQIQLKEISETKLKESLKQISELNEISKSKDNLIDTQNDALKMYEDKIKEFKKLREDLELSLATNIYNFKMKEDEFDSLFMVIEGILAKKKDKYEHNLNKLSPEVKSSLQSLVKQYKFFK